MEGTPQQQDHRKFVTTLTFGFAAVDMERADEAARAVLACAEEQGLQLLDGHTTNAREKTPLEQVSYGSEGIWRNGKAERGEWAESYDAASRTAVPAGQTG